MISQGIQGLDSLSMGRADGVVLDLQGQGQAGPWVLGTGSEKQILTTPLCPAA